MTRTRRVIPAAPEAVFAVLGDGRSYASWVVGAKQVRHVDDDWPAPGSALRHRIGAGPASLRDVTVVRECVPPRLLVLEARANPLGEARVELHLQPHPAGTQVVMDEVLLRPGFLARRPSLAAPFLWLRNFATLRRLERLARQFPASAQAGPAPTRPAAPALAAGIQTSAEPNRSGPPSGRATTPAGASTGDPADDPAAGDVTRRRTRRGGRGPEAVVIGSGPNGLVAANVLVDAGWDVVVLEAQPEPGGGVRSADYLGPGYVADVCSAFYPLAAASPVLCRFGLERYGLRWSHAPAVLAHPLLDGRCALLWRDLERTAHGLEALGHGDGDAWRQLTGLWEQVGEQFVDALFTPFPPLRSGLRLARRVRAAGTLRMARLVTLPVRRLLEEEFRGPGSLLLAGCALHADLAPEGVGSALYGWLLAMLGQQFGFPVPEGGAGQLTAALVRRLEDRGGRLRCSAPVEEVLVDGGRAVGVRIGGGERLGASRAVLADVTAPALYGGLVAWEHLPSRLRDDMRRFQWDFATVKLDWALSGPVPWAATDAGLAGTVHLSPGLDEMTRYYADLATGRIPADPFVLLGQMTTADSRRSPPGTQSLWAYTHVPHHLRADQRGQGAVGDWDAAEVEVVAGRIERQIERYAPGFTDRIVSRHVAGPREIEAHNANTVGGALGGGTAALHQQLIFRPTPGLGRPETPVRGLYLASSSAHPGAGVHGACGTNAALAALHGDRLPGRLGTASLSAAQRYLARPS